MIGGPPKVGWVIRYEYDWSDPVAAAADGPGKQRPAVIVLAVTRGSAAPLVRVAPITHLSPVDAALALELPAETKSRLGLDGERSWIVLDHANEFAWPGPDLRPVPGRKPATIYYGALPPALFAQVKRTLLGLLKARRVRARLRGD